MAWEMIHRSATEEIPLGDYGFINPESSVN
jgi:hypothetical protein